jgi:hypothetical protein
MLHLGKQRPVAKLYLLYEDNSHFLLRAGSCPTIILSKAPKFLLDLLFVVTVTFLKGCHRFSNILPLTSSAGCQVQDIDAVTGHMLLDVVLLSCVAARELVGLLQYGAEDSAVVALKTSSFGIDIGNKPLLGPSYNLLY